MMRLASLILILAASVASAQLAVPAYSSDPGAPATLYLDFHGEPSQPWGLSTVPATPAYDIDGDPAAFSPQEQANIRLIWTTVSQAFAPYDLNVTTVDPGQWDLIGAGAGMTTLPPRHQQRIVIGGSGSWTGTSEGGIAFVGSFYQTNLPDTAYVFPGMLSNGDPSDTADDTVHEAGHAFGLQHQSLWSGGVKISEYNPGTATVAPWMGVAFGKQGEWWVGLNTNGVMQDDAAILSHTIGPAVAVPEPPSLPILAGAGMLLIFRRRRHLFQSDL